MPSTKRAAQKENPADEQPEVPLRDQIRERFQAGGEANSRGAIAKDFGLKYQQVYAYTKDLGPGEGAGGRARVMVEHNGEQRPRVEVIRELYAAGQADGATDEQKAEGKIGAIAKRLGVSYQIVYQATKNMREDTSTHDDDDTEEGTEEVADEAEESFEDEDEDEA
jgi:hypothetical protein